MKAGSGRETRKRKMRRLERDEELTYHRRGWAEAQVLALHHPGDGDADADADGCDDGIGGAANGDGDIEKRNLSEEFFTASERPKPWDWPQPAGVGDVSTLEGKCESARVRTCESVKVRICESVRVWKCDSRQGLRCQHTGTNVNDSVLDALDDNGLRDKKYATSCFGVWSYSQSIFDQKVRFRVILVQCFCGAS